MTAIEEILLKALNRPVELRKGQAVWNYAYQKFPCLVDKIDRKCDCYYNDARIDSFLESLQTLIDAEVYSQDKAIEEYNKKQKINSNMNKETDLEYVYLIEKRFKKDGKENTYNFGAYQNKDKALGAMFREFIDEQEEQRANCLGFHTLYTTNLGPDKMGFYSMANPMDDFIEFVLVRITVND